MANMYLSSISHTHGQRRLVRDLGEEGCDDARLKEDRLEAYRESAISTLAMAGDVGARTLDAGAVAPDVVVYATETADGHEIMQANAGLASALGIPSVVVLTVAGHGCGNLGLLLRVADGLLASSRAATILLVTADRVVSRPRMMAGALSVLSDGAAAVLASRDAPAGGQPHFLVHGLALRADARGGTADVSPAAQRRTVQLGRSAVAQLRAVTGRRPRDFTHALFNNYRLSSQRFLAGAAGFAPDQLLPGPVPDYAHSFAADLLTNCELTFGAGVVMPGDRLALSATGPHSWALIDLEVVG